MILYTENPKDSIRKLLELISEGSKVAAYEINIQKKYKPWKDISQRQSDFYFIFYTIIYYWNFSSKSLFNN